MTISAAPPTRCGDVNRATAWGRARAIVAGHSAMCASCGVSDACPMRDGVQTPARPSELAARLASMNEALARKV